MPKKYSIQEQEFELIGDNLMLLNKAAPLIAQLRKLTYEYSKDLDFFEIEAFKAELTIKQTAKSQIETILNTGTIDGVALTDIQRTEYTAQFEILTKKINDGLVEFESNVKWQNLIKLKSELDGYALIELMTDIDLLKPIFKKILRGGNLEAINWDDTTVIGFVRDVVTDFFSVLNTNNLKL